MKIHLVDVDNTLVKFQPTAALFKMSFLRKLNPNFLLKGLFMTFLIKAFWYSDRIIKFQRKYIYKLFSEIEPETLKKNCSQISDQVMEAYKKNPFQLVNYNKKTDKIYLLTHCPVEIAKTITEKLKFDDYFALEIKNYFQSNEPIKNYSKYEIIKNIRKTNTEPIYYYCDDLIDRKALMEADRGFLVNASFWTKLLAKPLARKNNPIQYIDY